MSYEQWNKEREAAIGAARRSAASVTIGTLGTALGAFETDIMLGHRTVALESVARNQESASSLENAVARDMPMHAELKLSLLETAQQNRRLAVDQQSVASQYQAYAAGFGTMTALMLALFGYGIKSFFDYRKHTRQAKALAEASSTKPENAQGVLRTPEARP
jgi:hypothetical protein